MHPITDPVKLRTPLHVACDFGVSQTAILLMERASDLSSPVISAAMKAYANLPSIFNRAINYMFFRLFEDFTGFEDMAPTVTATILCFQLSGSFQLQPKELRSWLLSRRPKHLDSAMPIQSLISDELRTMFSSFSKAQKGNMDTAVRHSCTVKSSTLFRLLSDCGVISNLSEDEILFSLGIASENGNLIPLQTLMSIKISLQKYPGTDDRLLYQGCAELVKSILDENNFNKSPPRVTGVASAGPAMIPRYRTTPLMFAAIKDDVNVLRYLIEFGADVQAVDHHGRTALDHAIASNCDGSGAIIELLQAAQGKAELENPQILATGMQINLPWILAPAELCRLCPITQPIRGPPKHEGLVMYYSNIHNYPRMVGISEAIRIVRCSSGDHWTRGCQFGIRLVYGNASDDTASFAAHEKHKEFLCILRSCVFDLSGRKI